MHQAILRSDERDEHITVICIHPTEVGLLRESNKVVVTFMNPEYIPPGLIMICQFGTYSEFKEDAVAIAKDIGARVISYIEIKPKEVLGGEHGVTEN